MEKYFPADVSLRVEGDLAAAQSLFPAARQLLFRALRRQQLGGITNVNQAINGTDGSLVSVYLAGALKHVYVQPASRKAAPPVPVEKEELEQHLPTYVPHMVSGAARKEGHSHIWVREILHGGDPSTFELHQFNPSGVTEVVYGLDANWQDIEKLGITQGGAVDASAQAISAYPKASMFSGAMTRFYQALLGLGRLADVAQPEYLTGALPDTEPDVTVFPQFDWHWVRTHGVYNAGKDPWIVEISKLNGVLAMPMPLFDNTSGKGYRNWLKRIGDTETGGLVSEFGGIPTGEKFPTGTELADAIAAGKILVLLSPDDLLPFYYDADYDVTKSPFFAGCGWAFNTDGTEAHNTCNWYSHPEIALASLDDWTTDGENASAAYKRYMRTEHWKLKITLSNVNRNITPEAPAGTGTAILTLVEDGLLFSESDASNVASPPALLPYAVMHFPKDADTDETDRFFFFGRNSQKDYDVDFAPIVVFFLGDELQVVRQARNGISTGLIGGIVAQVADVPLEPDPASSFKEISFGTQLTVGFFTGSPAFGFPERTAIFDVQTATHVLEGGGYFCDALDMRENQVYSGVVYTWSYDPNWVYIDSIPPVGWNPDPYWVYPYPGPNPIYTAAGNEIRVTVGGDPGFYREMGMFIPAYCRESFGVLCSDHRFHPSFLADFSDFVEEEPSTQRCVVTNAGVIELQSDNFDRNDFFFQFRNYGVLRTVYVGATVNVGESKSLVISDGLQNAVLPASWGNVVIDERGDLGIPENTPAKEISYVGLP
ncbi:MAG TPA: hypothetical protein VMZ06_05440 [Candidatus Bathyarchaeia archaeon]|nr:hypothetical protein [Candidatus Bathyarchaeia archaeon]